MEGVGTPSSLEVAIGPTPPATPLCLHPLQVLLCPAETMGPDQSRAGVSGWHPRNLPGKAQNAWRRSVAATQSPQTKTNADMSLGGGGGGDGAGARGLPEPAGKGEGLNG